MRPPPVRASSAGGVGSPRSSLLHKLLALPRARPRAQSIEEGRALVEFREVAAEMLPRFQAELEEQVRDMDAVLSVAVQPHLRRVCFRLSSDGVDTARLAQRVARAETACRSEGTPLSRERELPDDELMHVQRWVELVADTSGLGIGLLLRAIPLLPRGVGGSAVVALTLVKSQARLRAPLDRRLGKDRTDLLLGTSAAFCQGLSQRPLSSLVDVGYRMSAVRELRARSRLFAQQRAAMFEVDGDAQPAVAFEQPVRPAPLPKGPLETYGDRAWVTALSAFGFSLVTSRSVRRGGAALLGALPKPAHLGREIYASEVGRLLANRGTLVLSSDALRRLDRVDCLVIDVALLGHARFSLGRIVVRTDDEGEQTLLEARARMLFDAARPLAVQSAEGYELGPLPLIAAQLDEADHATAHELGAEGSLVLGLCRGERLCALIEARIGKGSGASEMIDAAHRGGMRVAIAAERGAAFGYFGTSAVEVVPGGSELVTSLRDLQRHGHAVCYAGPAGSSSAQAAFAHADCSVGVREAGAPTPWAAHVICGADLEGLHMLLRACLLARDVSKRSANLALGAAAVGTLASALGKAGPSQRVMLVVNTASLISMMNALRQSAPLRGIEAAQADPTPWHALEANAVLARLQSTPFGLTEAQAAERARSHVQREPSAWLELGTAISEELLNPLAPLLAAGAGLSALVGSTLDAGLVAGVGGVNAVVGGVQRYRAERTIRRLAKPFRRQARVRRGGATLVLDAADLVPGDLVLLRPGDDVPADCRILESNQLEVDGSIITGESLPSNKDAAPSFEASLADRGCMLYAGTRVVGGSATAVAVAVGDQVEARRAVQSKDAVAARSGVEARLRELMQLTGPVATVGGLAVVLSGLLHRRGADELIETGVSMAVAALPEGLPLLANAAQLSTAERLSKRGAIVRNARCIEALGRVDVICLDKTGTLTAGQLELHRVSDALGVVPVQELTPSHAGVIASALRASADGRTVHRNPTDQALDRAAREAGIERSAGHTGMRAHAERPFESARGYHAVLSRTDGGMLLSVKGVPERLLPRCEAQRVNDERQPLDAQGREALLVRAEELASRGLRVLAVAERMLDVDVAEGELPVERLCFVGLLAFRDGTRPEAARTIKRLRAAGVEVVMLTGDHLNTAHSIAGELDFANGRERITGGALAHLSDDELHERVGRYGVFARVSPGQKVRIVRALQRSGRVVAMVGDGANDAPAMRAAHVGIALGQGCAPSARAAADILLADGSLERLLECIADARAMWLSVRDAVAILLGGNLGEIGFTVAGGLLSGKPPLNPRQLLLVNFLTDIAPAMAIALRTPAASTLEEMQNGRPDGLLSTQLNRAIAIRAASTALGASWAYGLGRLTGGKKRASTIALCALVGSQLGQTLLTRGSGRRVTLTAVGSAAVLGVLVQTPGLSHLLGCRPLGPVGWSFAMMSSAAATGTSALLSALETRVPSVRAAWRVWQQSAVKAAAAARAEAHGNGADYVKVPEFGRWLGRTRINEN